MMSNNKPLVLTRGYPLMHIAMQCVEAGCRPVEYVDGSHAGISHTSKCPNFPAPDDRCGLCKLPKASCECFDRSGTD